MRFKVVGATARPTEREVVFLENGALVLEIEGLKSSNNILYARVKSKTYETAIKDGKAKIPRSALSSGVLYCEIVGYSASGQAENKIVFTPIEIASAYSQVSEPLVAYPQVDKVLQDMSRILEEVEELRKSYEQKYEEVKKQQEQSLELLNKISKSYNLGISLFNSNENQKEKKND